MKQILLALYDQGLHSELAENLILRTAWKLDRIFSQAVEKQP